MKRLLFYHFQLIYMVLQFEKLYRRAIQSITAEDYEKVNAYRHKEDSLAVLAGRLFLRQATKRVYTIHRYLNRLLCSIN
jgi:hypothetical protein